MGSARPRPRCSSRSTSRRRTRLQPLGDLERAVLRPVFRHRDLPGIGEGAPEELAHGCARSSPGRGLVEDGDHQIDLGQGLLQVWGSAQGTLPRFPGQRRRVAAELSIARESIPSSAAPSGAPPTRPGRRRSAAGEHHEHGRKGFRSRESCTRSARARSATEAAGLGVLGPPRAPNTRRYDIGTGVSVAMGAHSRATPSRNALGHGRSAQDLLRVVDLAGHREHESHGASTGP